ncbi:DUF2590 family protein [Vibrio sp. 10N.261.55.A7]|uniref:DUF2590 family protein n=1 Tax=Vibrio sp. 10N.261.55.A7 TaxID=1880851 RepID=UPI000C85DC70|nr:DUF2590 family protein [Vibrio sp. 10N.261.55.A7]PMJ92865.1 hypothetical protein BCU12_06905 [Vibrio sp. 10N.261.55.A7]
MPDKAHIDIKVIEGGWNMDAGQQAEQASDLYSIAQDIKHRIMESGLARMLVAERNPTLRADVLVQIEQKAEQDERVIPGTVTASEVYGLDRESLTVQLTGQAYDYEESINIEVTP